MKNLKKIIIFGGLLLIIFYCIYNYAKEKDYEEVIIEDVFTNTEEIEVLELDPRWFSFFVKMEGLYESKKC